MASVPLSRLSPATMIRSRSSAETWGTPPKKLELWPSRCTFFSSSHRALSLEMLVTHGKMAPPKEGSPAVGHSDLTFRDQPSRRPVAGVLLRSRNKDVIVCNQASM
ncbi:hypothetical protein GCM10025790_28110 [Nesterenkonia rhizosphaerae]|uniref:Uncharacterized protein n=1 Tax=Nesterenkonia rhizosphaerae TaxID=1348272 RepID=A0ABP9G562_9MICC